MYRLTRSARSVSLRGGRSVYRPVLAIVSRSKATSQGHATGKSEKTLHKDADVQSASVKAGRSAKKASEGSASEEHQPFDVARQGGSGGTSKSAEGTGSFKDQVGGQEGGAGVMGGTEKTGDQTVLGKLKDTFGGTSRSPGVSGARFKSDRADGFPRRRGICTPALPIRRARRRLGQIPMGLVSLWTRTYEGSRTRI